MNRVKKALKLLKPLAVALAAAPMMAHAWTDKPVRIVVPAPAGGTMDVVARILSEAISAETGKPVIVDNKPGAGGAIGVHALLSAPPDGQTIMVTASNILTEIPLVMKTSYDPMKDVKPVTMVGRSAMVLVGAPSIPANDLKGLVGYLKGKGSPASYASYSAGTSSNYAGAIFSKKAGLDLVHAPFPGSPPALQNVIGGQVDIMFDGLVTSLPMIKSGKVKVYGVGYSTRLPQLPDVPTMAEQGFPEIDFSNWVGAIVSSKTPDEIVKKINAVLEKIGKSPKVQEKLVAQNFMPMTSKSPEQLAKITRDEYARNAQIVKTYNIQFNH